MGRSGDHGGRQASINEGDGVRLEPLCMRVCEDPAES